MSETAIKKSKKGEGVISIIQLRHHTTAKGSGNGSLSTGGGGFINTYLFLKIMF